MIKTAKKVKDVDGYKQPVAIYELSVPLRVERTSSNFLLGGVSKIEGFKDRVALFLCDESGELLFFYPAIDVESDSVETALSSQGYTLTDADTQESY